MARSKLVILALIAQINPANEFGSMKESPSQKGIIEIIA
jgi:hypothetical protein